MVFQKNFKRKIILKYLLLKIQSNQIEVGQRMPSEGEIKIKFQCNRHTVAHVYRKLKFLGFVKFVKGSGFFLVKQITNDFKIESYVKFTKKLKQSFQVKKVPIKLLPNIYFGEKTKKMETFFWNKNFLIAVQYIFVKSNIVENIYDKLDSKNLFNVLTNHGVVIADFKSDISFLRNDGSIKINDKTIMVINSKLYNEEKKQIIYISNMISIKSFQANNKKIVVK